MPSRAANGLSRPTLQPPGFWVYGLCLIARLGHGNDSEPLLSDDTVTALPSSADGAATASTASVFESALSPGAGVSAYEPTPGGHGNEFRLWLLSAALEMEPDAPEPLAGRIGAGPLELYVPLRLEQQLGMASLQAYGGEVLLRESEESSGSELKAGGALSLDWPLPTSFACEWDGAREVWRVAVEVEWSWLETVAITAKVEQDADRLPAAAVMTFTLRGAWSMGSSGELFAAARRDERGVAGEFAEDTLLVGWTVTF
jgi:hypothetical protein